MEHIANPAMEELLSVMNAKPAAKWEWETIKSKALTVSEVGNLLMQRGKQDQPEWLAFSDSLHDNGKSLFEAAQSRDAAIAKTSLASISENCTNCHRVFRNPLNASVAPIHSRDKAGGNRELKVVELNPLEARTLDDVTAVYNEQTRQLRAELFNPPIPDLTTEQMRAAMLDAATRYRKIGKVEIASALEDTVKSNRLVDPLSFMGSLGTALASFRQITPQFHFKIANNALLGFPLPKAELRYSHNGWSSRAWGEIHPPITGKWNLVSVEERGGALTDDAFNDWRKRHASWTDLTIDEKLLTMSGDKFAVRFDFAIDHDSGPLQEFRISQNGDTKFAGVFMRDVFIDDTTLVFAVDLEGSSKAKKFQTKDGKTTNLTYRRDGEAEIQVNAPLTTDAMSGTVEPAAAQLTEEILNAVQGHPKATDRTRP